MVLSALLVTLALGCTYQPEFRDSRSNCTVIGDDRWVNAGFVINHSLPRRCPVIVQGSGTSFPRQDYKVDVIDRDRKTTNNNFYTDFKDARGIVRGMQSNFFQEFGGTDGRRVTLNSTYFPGQAGFPGITRTADTAVNYVILGVRDTARSRVILGYQHESPPTMPASYDTQRGYLLTLRVNDTAQAMATRFSWAIDGAAPVTAGASYQKAFSTAGTHRARITVTSGFGTVTALTTTITVTDPPPCGSVNCPT